MKKIIAYLKANWPHLSILAIMAIYNALVQAGLIPAGYQTMINLLFTSGAIGVTKNSGTKDAVKSIQNKTS